MMFAGFQNFIILPVTAADILAVSVRSILGVPSMASVKSSVDSSSEEEKSSDCNSFVRHLLRGYEADDSDYDQSPGDNAFFV